MNLNESKIRGNGVFLIKNKNDEFEIVLKQDDVVYDYPDFNESTPIKDEVIKGWKKLS